MGNHNQTVGKWGESQACQFLIRNKFRIVDRNFHSTQGEIDIIAQKQEDYYFIEVKTRFAGDFATDLAITKTKLHKLSKTIKRYCYKKNITEGSFITAGLLVIINKLERKIGFRLAVFY